ncbi:phage portal protein [Sphingomonas sp. PB1R3]|uniref:phage portal protein n=1 Tax=Sphingomonas flavida TaxID=3096154 RepID=UPI002FC8051E
MRMFGRKTGRGAARPLLGLGLARSGVPLTGSAPSYETQVREGYLRNPVAQRAVRMVAGGMADAPLTASHPELVALVAARSEGQALLETVATHMLLHGNAYVQILRDAEGEVAELFALRPERVTMALDASGWPAAFLYRAGGRVTTLPVDPVRGHVVHLKSCHPLDDHYGLGCLGAAAGAIAIHNAAATWNRALLDNAARPSGALVYDPGDGSTLTPDQFERLRAEMEGFAGSGNAGRPLLLEGGLKWQAMSLTPAELDFNATKSSAAREIALAFGVPPMLLGLPGDNTYANYREANRALWRQAILPLAGGILGGLAQGLAGWFEGASLSVDVNRVTALAEERQMLWAMAASADFLDSAEKRQMVGLS